MPRFDRKFPHFDPRAYRFEGKFHQVKKMVESVGKKVTYLKRLQMKNLKLDTSLQIGKFRELSEDELVDLMNDL